MILGGSKPLKNRDLSFVEEARGSSVKAVVYTVHTYFEWVIAPFPWDQMDQNWLKYAVILPYACVA